jgi:hypothetical protein
VKSPNSRPARRSSTPTSSRPAAVRMR